MLKSNFLKKLGLCVLSAALCASAFAACGKDGDGDGDNGKKIDENTNISDVVSEKVADEAAWKAAFDVTKFTNFSMKTVSKQTVAAKTSQNALTFLYTGDKAYYSVTETDENGKTQRNDVYLAKANGDFSVYGVNYVNGEKTFEGAYDKNNSGEYNYMMTGEAGTMMLTQLGEVPFAEVSYSEEKKGYIYSKDGAEAVLKIADGLFAGYAMSGKSGEGESKMSMEMSAIYYNIGSTEITLPEKMTMPAAEETMTKADFYAEVKKREDASIAAKKWGTVNVSGTQTKNGVTANVYANNAPISHGMGFSMVKLTVSEGATGVSSTNVGVFGYSVMLKNTTIFSTEEFKKVGANLQAVWVATVDDETSSMKVTLNADGYLTEYEMKSESTAGTVEQKLTFSGYAGEYTSGKKPGSDSGKQPGDSDKKTELTKNTNFTTLKSEKVTAEGWKQAFSNSNEAYRNFTAIAYAKIGVNNIYYVQRRAEKSGFYGVAFKTDFVTDPKHDTYVYENKDGEYMERTTSGDEAYGRLRDGMPIPMLYSCFCPDFSEYFSLFTYDETSNAYVYEGDGIEANSYLWYGVGTKKYVKAELKIVNGALACVNTVDEDGRATKTSFFDFGTTDVELPEIEK